jgi:hypothetical protein
VAATFPELKGRAVAVGEIAPLEKTELSIKRPVAAVGFINGSASDNYQLNDELVVEFMLETARYPTEGGDDSPFYVFFDYEDWRDRLYAAVKNWQSPRGAMLSPTATELETNGSGAYCAFRFSASQRWCKPKEAAPGCGEAPTDAPKVSFTVQMDTYAKDCT